MAKKTKLEELADQFRVTNVIKNTYYNESGKEYKATHPNALADGDSKGRGTNGNSDAINTATGGNSIDIYGNPSDPGSGRLSLIANNESKYGSVTGPNGYGPNKPYYPGYILDKNQ